MDHKAASEKIKSFSSAEYRTSSAVTVSYYSNYSCTPPLLTFNYSGRNFYWPNSELDLWQAMRLLVFELL